MAIMTKVQLVEKALRSSIQSGRWNTGDPLPSERELLQEFDVSRATLRDALNVLATDGLLVRKHGSGTYVSGAPKTGVTAILGRSELMLSSMHQFFGILANLSRQRMQESGFRAILSMTHGETVEEIASSIQLLDKRIVSELLGVMDITMDSTALCGRIADLGIPMVAVDAGAHKVDHSVALDYASMTKLAVGALHSHGHKDFALMHISDPGNEYRERIPKGFDKLQLAAVGYREDRLVPVPRSVDFHEAYDIFIDWWSRKDRPNAIFFFDDVLCDVSTRAILELGIKVPEELAVITMAYPQKRFHLHVPLTRLEFDPAEAVDAAWSMLQKLIREEPVDEPTVYIEPHVVAGESL